MRNGVVSNVVSNIGLSLAVCAIGSVWPPDIQAQTLAYSGRQVESSVTAGPQVAKGLDVQVSIDAKSETLESVLQRIVGRAGLVAAFGDDVKSYRVPVTLRVNNVTAREALQQVLRGTGVIYRETSTGTIAFAAGTTRSAVQGTIAGKVIDAKTKKPISGATVTLNQASSGVTTGSDGLFRISAEAGEHTVHIKALGFVRQSKQITVTADETVTIEILLAPSASVLDEVVVTGTVVATERKAIPTPITVITADEIEKRGITRLEQLFRGEVPGVLALELGSEVYADELGAMATSQMYVRGASGLGASYRSPGRANPLKTYVDGVELLEPSALGMIDPQSIERIEIITGPQAATIYGSGAMGGVMQIFTKKSAGQTRMELGLRSQYGMLESNLNNGRTPLHNEVFSFTGGAGPVFSYRGTVSYRYQGQWQPGLFNRAIATTVGVSHIRGGLSLTGNMSVSIGSNGTNTAEFGQNPLVMAKGLTGEWRRYQGAVYTSRRVSRSTNQTVSVNADYRQGASWQHRITIGRNQSDFAIDPQRPSFKRPNDTLYEHASSTGKRTTANYNVTFSPAPLGIVSSTITMGVNGSIGDRTQVTGSTEAAESPTFVQQAYEPRVTRLIDNQSWGGFGQWQLGFWSHLFVTLGVRGERNPSYGRDHAIDWTPTNGVTYTFDVGDMTVKFLGSYGKATRPPADDLRLAKTRANPNYSKPEIYTYQLEAPGLRPEYSRGPQGGVEVYYGNRISLTMNRYVQRVTDLIQNVVADSLPGILASSGEEVWVTIRQNRNVASLKNHGWEATGSLNLWRFSVKGTYSWMDSRIESVDPRASGTSYMYYPGMSFNGTPTHTANVTLQYAWGGLSVVMASNIIGSHSKYITEYKPRMAGYYGRIEAYQDRVDFPSVWHTVPGYAKSDLSVQQRATQNMSFVLNITNLGNSYGSEGSNFLPALGRRVLFGVSLRNR